MSALIVTAAAAVLPTVDGREQYLYQGAIFDSEGITEAGVEHARTQGLIGDAPEVVEEEPVEAALTQADIDIAVQTAVDEKDAELAEARTAVEDRAREVAQEIADIAAAKAEAERSIAEQREQLEQDRAALEAAKAEANKTEPAKAPATKTTAKQQS